MENNSDKLLDEVVAEYKIEYKRLLLEYRDGAEKQTWIKKVGEYYFLSHILSLNLTLSIIAAACLLSLDESLFYIIGTIISAIAVRANVWYYEQEATKRNSELMAIRQQAWSNVINAKVGQADLQQFYIYVLINDSSRCLQNVIVCVVSASSTVYVVAICKDAAYAGGWVFLCACITFITTACLADAIANEFSGNIYLESFKYDYLLAEDRFRKRASA